MPSSSPASAPSGATATIPDRLVVFAHGKESGPWGIKISHLATIAKARGFSVLSPDYRNTMDPDLRVQQLIALAPRAGKLILAGSSMGGYVSAMACNALRPDGLFLLAPALYFPQWDSEPEQIPQHCAVVHGWQDEIVPVERAQRFAARHQAELHLLEADHSMNHRLPMLGALFAEFLDRALGESE